MKQLYLLLITLLVSLSAYAERSGTCGANLKWKLTDEGVLTITGTGEMYNWEDGHAKPWSRNSNIKQVIIGDGVTTIGEEAFSFCYSLESITIPNSVTTIGESAFKACSSLTLITIPNSVTTIGGRAFDSCRSLTSITIPKNVTTIGIHAFYDCRSLTSITIPNSVTTIGYYAFSGCKNVKQITVEAVTPPECSTNTFDGVNTKECKLIVPKNSVDAYKKADGWKEFFLIEGITTGIINNIYNKIENVDVYTIDGVKCLSKANVNEINALPKGVYIINGKKIIIK
jgi:cell surface protein